MGIQKTTLALAISTILASSVSADITGVVYKDFDLNGAKNGGDIGIAGVAVTAACEDGTTLSTVSDALGQYVVEVATQGNKCRIEAAPTVASGLGASANAGGSASLVSIVADGSTHNISVASPASYCQASPDVAMVALPGGEEFSPNTFGSLYTLPTPPIGTFDNDEQKRITKAKGEDTGAIWGLAWSKFENKLYSAASVKRYVDVKNNDAGAIYITDNATNTTSLFTSVPNVGYSLTNRDLSENQDLDTLPLIGRVGLGDLDISQDGKTLYTVNLYAKELVIIDIATKAITTVAIPNPYVGAGACPDADVRPWALTIEGTDVFIGSVCETGIESGVGASVQKYTGNAMMTTVAMTNTLRYLKPRTYDPSNPTTDYHQNVDWNPSVEWHPHRPVLSDIVFDNNGDMILGYTDLGAYARVTGNSSGDVRRMCLQADGSYIDENTGAAPTSCASHTQVYEGNSEVYHEYYIGDYFSSTPAHPEGHPELALGGLAMQPGSSEVAISAVDATDWYQAGGLSFLDNKTGEKNSAQALVSGGEPERTIYGSKAGGMGDIEILCDPAPIEIGNYVWEDSNGDGIQDPSEPALANVKVSLYQNNIKVGETTTDVQGHYYFGGVSNNGMTAGKVDPQTAYEIRIAKADVGGKSPTVADANVNADDVRDSDATDNGTEAVITYTTKDFGQNDHTLDFGFAPAFGCATGLIYHDDNQDAVHQLSEAVGSSITLKITDKFGTVHTVETDSTGNYTLENIPAGTATVEVDGTDTDIPEGATWLAGIIQTITVSEGVAPNCSDAGFRFDTPAPIDFDPKSVASCANPTSITWEGATVSTGSAWHDIAANSTLATAKSFTTAGGDVVGVKMYIEDPDGELNNASAGTFNGAVTAGTDGAFNDPFLTLYLGDQAAPGNGTFAGPDCAANGYDLEAGEKINLVVEFDEAVVLDNWRIRDVDSGDLRSGVADWNWQDGIQVTAEDADGNIVTVESKIGSAGEGLINDNGVIHTDPATYNGGDVATGAGTTPTATNGHIVLTSNFIPVKKITITHLAGPNLACQTRSALAMAGLAVCKPLHISGTVFDDGNGDNPRDGTCENKPDGEQLYVQLVDDKGLVIDTHALTCPAGNQAGTGVVDYFFDKNIKPDSEYTVVLTTENKVIGNFASTPSLPAGWNNVGDVNPTDTVTPALEGNKITADGKITVSIAQASIDDIDFGINKKPAAESYKKPLVLNPNGNVKVPLTQDCTASNFIADKEDGTPAKIKITSLPSLDTGVLYYNGTAVVLNQVIDNVDPCLLEVDPADGDVEVGFNYVSIDAAGVESDPATMTAPFSTLTVSGTLFLDTAVDDTVTGTPTAVACSNTLVPLYVSLIAVDGKVLSSKLFDAQDGSYFFNYGDGIKQNTNYTIIVSQNKGIVGDNAPAIVLPENCSHAYGENIGSVGTDGAADGSIAVNVGTENIPEINFAIGIGSVKVGNRVWIEDDNDGDATTGNITPVVGTTVTASCAGTDYTGVTDNAGLYFIDVPMNTSCTVSVATPASTLPAIGSTDNTSGENDKTHDGAGTTVAVGTTDDLTLDFGFQSLVKIGNLVWIEDDNDGDATTGNITPVVGTTVTASCAGVNYTGVTDSAGNYEIMVPTNTSCSVSVPTPAETLPAAGSDDKTSGENNKTHDGSGTTVDVLTAEDLTLDFGFYKAVTVKIGNRIWIEDDNDGDATTGNITVPPEGSVVIATASDGTIYTGKTDANGFYEIDVPENDTYWVTVNIGKVATDGSEASTTAGENDRSHNGFGKGTKVVIETEDNMTLDFGFTPQPLNGAKPGMVLIGDRIWIEDDNDGKASTGTITKPEAGLVVTATAADGTKYTGTTDADGNYRIEVPQNATYTVTAEAPKGTCAALTCAKDGDQDVPNAESVAANKAENDLTHDSIHGTKVTVGTQDNLSVDFGFCPVTVVTGVDGGGSTSYLMLSLLGLFGLRRRLASAKK